MKLFAQWNSDVVQEELQDLEGGDSPGRFGECGGSSDREPVTPSAVPVHYSTGCNRRSEGDQAE